jgi:hypothetical protein
MIESTLILFKGIGELTKRKLRVQCVSHWHVFPPSSLFLASAPNENSSMTATVASRLHRETSPWRVSTPVDGLDGWDAVRLRHEWRRGRTDTHDRPIEYNEAVTRNLGPAGLIHCPPVERHHPRTPRPLFA